MTFRFRQMCAMALAIPVSLATAAVETGQMARADAVTLASQLIMEVEGEALGPRDAAEQARAKQALLALVNAGDAPALDRATVYAAARRYLGTVDSDGHAILWSQSFAQDWEQKTRAADAARADVARVAHVDGHDVLVLRPPQSTFQDIAAEHEYGANLSERIETEMRGAHPCAVVVDLSDQLGGNAWPAIALLGGLLTPDNKARFEDRTGRRTPVVSAKDYAWIRDVMAPLPANPLASLAGAGIGIVLTPNTASAGEMVAFALAGEPTARSFGRPSYGMTTANVVVSLADGATALISKSRYAMEGAPAVRGPLKPDFPAELSESVEQSVQRAAQWAVANSALCRSGAKRASQAR